MPSRFLENVVSLYSLQVANYLLPLLTLPYLVRVLGPQNYGLVTFSQAVVQYFVLLTSYGFNLSATQQIAQNKTDVKRVGQITSAVLLSKFLLASISAVALVLLVASVPTLRLRWFLYVANFGYVIAEVVFPVWLYQGLEDMKFITIGNVIARLLSTVVVFTVVRGPRDYDLVPIVLAGGSVLGGGISFYLAMIKYRLPVRLSSKTEVWGQLKDGWLILLSTMSVSLYTTSNPVILGIFSNSTQVGYYSVAVRLIGVAQNFLGVVSQIIYPHVSQLIMNSKVEGLHFLRKVTLRLGGISLVTSLIFLVLAKPIVLTIFGEGYVATIPMLRILSVLPLMISLSNIFGAQTMLNLGFRRRFTLLTVLGASINIILSFVFVPLFYGVGTAICVAVSETAITIGMFEFLRNKGVNLLFGGLNYDGI